MNTIREIEKINKEELDRGIAGTPASWHTKYAKSAWVYIGNLDHELTEGDIICVFSQYGEVEDMHLAREEETGKSRGFTFLKYEDARSCVLAVDNFIGVQLLGRPIRIDHVEKYRLPKKLLEAEEGRGLPNVGAGHAYQDTELSNKFNIHQGQDLFAPLNQTGGSDKSVSSHDSSDRKRKGKHKKKKTSKRKHESRKERKRHRHDSDFEQSDDKDASSRRKKRRKTEKEHKHKRRDRTYEQESTVDRGRVDYT